MFIITPLTYVVIFSIFYSLFMNIIFKIKKSINTPETKIYSYILLVNLIGLILHLLCDIVSYNYHSIPQIFSLFIYKSYLFHFFIFSLLILRYTFLIIYDNKIDHKRLTRMFYFLSVVVLFSIIALPNELYQDFENLIFYTNGSDVKLMFIIVGIIEVAIFLLLITNIRKINNKKTIPILLFLSTSIITTVVQRMHPELIISDCVDSFTCLLMYFTIENPDVKLLAQVELAKEHAEKANRAKTDFLSSMSHEIRTPLNAIVGFSEMIQTEDDMDEIKSEAKDIVMASHTLLEIVNGILDISKIEANKMEIVNKEYELLPELENLSKLMIPRIGDKPLELRCKFAEDIPDVMYGDIAKIKEVITNILTNAVKYTEEGHIDFEVNCINEKDFSSLVIKVADTGRGIKKDQIDKLFTKFQRLDEDKNTTIEGTGLGLAITKSLVEMMGGKIIVNSEYGEGSTFTIYLKQKIVKLHKESDKKVYDDRDDYDFSGYTVLVVDDNQLNLKVATKLLNRYNITVDTASDGFECIDKIKAGNQYDLVLLDDMMPRMKGTETLTRLKQDSNYSIPTIALTANAITGMKEQYISMGFNDYLGKPIEKMELLRVLSKYLNKRKNIVKENPDIKEEKVEKIEIEESNNYNDKKILVVDDNKINIKIATKMLEKYNCVIESASSGQECLDKVKTTKYDIIFMDNMMPGMDGIETLKELKKIDGFNTPVIVLTADAITGSKERFLNEGFDDYISKPIDRNYLDEVVTKILNKDQ